MCNNKYDDDDDYERWLAALSIGPGIFEIVCMYSARAGRTNVVMFGTVCSVCCGIFEIVCMYSARTGREW